MKQPPEEHVNTIANRARALGDVTRVRILYVLARGEQPVGSIASAISAVIYSIASDDLIEWCDYLGHRQLTRGGRVGSR